ncbi:A/G-specific adenine glycosylase [Alphaproteobacteria bacterium]|nr:A/G-specific adenine glycosylase [Alphaproteobacteria bacterium]
MPRPQTKNKTIDENVQEYRGQILEWYNKHQRELPWRNTKGQKPDPYKVWMSEIMLQQTTVQAVKSYYTKFLKRWPNVKVLAAADREDIMAEWAGLGYYSRARNLHACANIVANEHGGKFPQTQTELKKLPGIGDYTSAAITAIAFNKPATVVDGNIERIMARFHAITEPMPKSKPLLKEKAAELFHEYKDRPGDLAQALMDIGATICTPKSPKCAICPISEDCEGRAQAIAETLPTKLKKKPKPQKEGFVYLITNDKNQILLHKRPEKGMLAGTIGLPTSEWNEDRPSHLKFLGNHSALDLKSFVTHSFTHFDLKLHLNSVSWKKNIGSPDGFFWINKADVAKDTFPTLFRKALNLLFE